MSENGTERKQDNGLTGKPGNNPKGGPASTQFKVGNPGGPGRPKDLLTKDKVQRRMSRMAMLTKAELQKVIESPDTNMLDLMIAKTAMRAADDGDQNRFNFILERTVGKVKDEVRVETDTREHAEARLAFARAVMLDPAAREAAALLAERVAEQKALSLPALPETHDAEYEPKDDDPVETASDDAAD